MDSAESDKVRPLPSANAESHPRPLPGPASIVPRTKTRAARRNAGPEGSLHYRTGQITHGAARRSSEEGACVLGNLQCLVLDCPDVLELARFYRSLLGGIVNQPDSRWSLDHNWATLHTGSGLVLGFQRADDYRPPQWPDPAHPQQFHLDIGVEDLDLAERQVLGFGATRFDGDHVNPDWRVYADPAGHPFCLVRE